MSNENNTKHTPEPWDFVYENGAWEGFCEPDSGDFEVAFRADKEETAARIVACVNAMAGIEHPEKWREVQIERIKALAKLRQQRDELMKALEFIAEMDEHRPSTAFPWVKNYAKETITKVKGCQP